ncbi:MAG: hypothetical protein ABI123_05795 [Ginsengibacter sp.]|jgi:hypothetical protein
MRTIFFIFLVSFLSINSFAQNGKINKKKEKKERIQQFALQEEEGVVTYKKSFAFGAKLASDGYGISFELARANSVKKSMLYQIEFGERKSKKEIKQQYNFNQPFIFGKENFFYPLKLGVQQQLLIGNKSNKNGVSVTANYGGGASLALLRPYYVQIVLPNGLSYVKYDSKDSLNFLFGQLIAGPPISKGWNELTVTPGLYAKTSLRFDYGAFNELLSAIEVGVTAEYYSKPINQMVLNDSKQFFFSGYFSILFGKRR